MKRSEERGGGEKEEEREGSDYVVFGSTRFSMLY